MSEDGVPTPPQQPGPPPQYPAYLPPPPNHGSAVTALVLGILSIVLCGFFTGIPAMVMGRRVVREVRASGGAIGGEGLGQAGFWTGLIGTVLSCLSGLLVVGVFAFGGVVSSTFEQTCTSVGANADNGNC
jgi:hypothetical protein